MNQVALKKTRIIKGLSRIPNNKLDHVQKFVDSMINTEEHSERSSRSLKGVWKGQGFEKQVSRGSYRRL